MSSAPTIALLEEIRARREREEDAWAMRQYKRSATARDRQAQEIYDEGRREERTRAKTRSSRSSTKARPASRRRSSSRRRRPAPLRQAQRQLAAPVRGQAVSAVRSVGLSLAVIGLYQLVHNAGAVEGALGGLGRGFEWLASPNRSIPYAKS